MYNKRNFSTVAVRWTMPLLLDMLDLFYPEKRQP